MKKRISLLIALVMICTAVLSAIPLSANAEESYRKTWTLQEEIEKSLADFKVGEVGTPDWSTSVFNLGRTIWGTYHNVSSGVKTTNGEYNFALSDDGKGSPADSNAASDQVWKNGYSLKSDGTLVAGLQYQGETMTISFTAPVSGTYALSPAKTDKSGSSIYSKTNSMGSAFNSHIRIYTDAVELFSTSVFPTPNEEGYTEYFTQNGEVWVSLSKGSKIYLDICPKNAEGGSGTGWVNGGILTALNFTVSLEATVETDVNLYESYNIKDEIDKAIPETGLEVNHKGASSTVATTTSPVKADTYYHYKFDAINTEQEQKTAKEVEEAFLNSTVYNIEGYNTWGKNPWALAHGFKTGATENEFAIRDTAFNYSWYNVKVNKNTGLVTMTTQGLAVHWRVSFRAPKDGTYFIDLSSVTASSLTNQRAKFYIYTSTSGLNPEDGKRTDSTEMIYVGDFYANRTNVLSPCENGYIPVDLKAGEKIYFESEFFNGATTYWGSGLQLSYTLNIIKGEEVDIKVNDNITLSSTKETGKKLNEKFTLAAAGTPNATTGNTIHWRTSDPSVATVDDSGNVTVVGRGECYIIAYNEYTEARCLVSTASAGTVTSVEFTEDKVDIDPYTNKKLEYKTDGTPVNVKFTSSDPYTIDVLNDGTLIFKDYGDPVTITVNVDGREDTCVVTPIAHTHDSTLTEVDLKDATCAVDGTLGYHCATCNQVVKTVAIAAPGHDFETRPSVITTYPHIGTGGIRSYTCDVCGEVKEERMEAGELDHIEIGTLPSRVYYELGETLDVSGMVLEVHFKNYDFAATISDLSDIEFNYDFTTAGEKTVTFDYYGVTLSFNAEVVADENPLMGDVNGDGNVDDSDVDTLMQAVAGSAAKIKFFNADIDGNKKLDIMDIMLLRRHIAGYSSEYFN